MTRHPPSSAFPWRSFFPPGKGFLCFLQDSPEHSLKKRMIMRRPHLLQAAQPRCLKPLYDLFIFRGMQRTCHIHKTASRQQTPRKRKRNAVLRLRKMRHPIRMTPDIRTSCQHPQTAARHIRQNISLPLPHGGMTGIRQDNGWLRKMKSVKMLRKLPQS